MSNNLNYYLKYINFQGSQSDYIQDMADSLSEQYSSAINSFDILINSDRSDTIYKHDDSTLTPIKCVVDYGHKWNKTNIENPFAREMWIQHNTLQVGEVVDFEAKKSKEKKTYILTKQVENDQGYDVFQMEETTTVLKWLNSKGDICSSPVITESATKYSDGTWENAKIKIGDTRLSITFPANTDTNEIQIGKRFLLDKTHAYEVSDTGVTSPEGLRELVLTQTEIHKDIDNLDLLIADYFGKAHEYRMEIVNKNVVLTKSDTCKLQVNIYDRNVKVDNPEISFAITDNNRIISIEGNTITALKEGNTNVSVKFKDISDVINIIVIKEETNNYICEIVGSDTIGLNRTKTYIAKFYNNGAEITDIAEWSITDENNEITDFANIINSDNTKCTVKATSKWLFTDDKSKYFHLHLKGATGKDYIKKIKILPN